MVLSWSWGWAVAWLSYLSGSSLPAVVGYELHQCYSDVVLGPVAAASKKGFAVDDTTFRFCSHEIPGRWPNADEPVTSLRLFKAWDPNWQDDRLLAWQNLKAFVTSTGAKVLLGTQITCVEEDDLQAWEWTKELLQLLEPSRVMGLAIGNELELLWMRTSYVTDECVNQLWKEGRLWNLFTTMVEEFDNLGFGAVPVTSVFGGLALAGNDTHPFYEAPGKALVNTFLVNATQRYGDRYAWTWTTYPYFDPNEQMDVGTSDRCDDALSHSLCWESTCDAPKSMAYTRRKMEKVTGKRDSTMWIGETGWPSSGYTDAMKACNYWASNHSSQEFYRNFLHWDLGIPGEEPPDHVFYFTLRDALNFGNGEHFGLIEQCFQTGCKLHSEGFEPPTTSTAPSSTSSLGSTNVLGSTTSATGSQSDSTSSIVGPVSSTTTTAVGSSTNVTIIELFAASSTLRGAAATSIATITTSKAAVTAVGSTPETTTTDKFEPILATRRSKAARDAPLRAGILLVMPLLNLFSA
ncbi:unnamed protein product [Polarella glacialis]|uniref:Uncharacterized protein n=1 Tax=Polarella glacialis TaxID=89957 RepID=A0A813GW15_POLGL|nr:unnamed protein product [Polarella glacialis]